MYGNRSWSSLSLSLSLSLLAVAPNLEHRASVKRYVSLQFLNPKTVGRTPWTGDQYPSQGRYLYKHRINTNIHALSGIQPTIPAFERAKIARPL
jgi:hypothetical protein